MCAADRVHVYDFNLYSPAVLEWLPAYKAYSPCKPLIQHELSTPCCLFTIDWVSLYLQEGDTEQDGTERMCRHCQDAPLASLHRIAISFR